MKTNEWTQIEELFLQSLTLSFSERAEFLNRVCAGNDSLRQQVESLLANDGQAQSFLEQPPSEIAAELLSAGTPRFEKGQLIGHYEVIRCLGAGGMGEVHLAHDSRLNRCVAIKVLPHPFLSDDNRVRRFAQEARAASALNHPSIVTIHEVGQVDGAHFIVAEFIDGQTLSRRLAQDGPMNVEEAIDVALQVANALDRAHAAGIVHRDIKPDNIMIRPDGLVKVLDFGLAKLSETEAFTPIGDATTILSMNTNPGVLMGTVLYMSPEQARGQQVDARTDIWSLGVVLFEMLAGKPPFAGETPNQVIAEVLNVAVPPLRSHVQRIPAALNRIVATALQKNVAERYPSARAFTDDLRDVRAQLQNPAPSWRRRGTIAVASLLIVAAAVIGYFANARQPIHSLAVVPFVNVGDETTEYLTNGISESLVNALSKTPQLQVTPRSAASRYVLTGKVASRGDDVEIQLDLLDVENNSRLWGETFSRQRVQLLDVQREIAATVISKLGLTSGPEKAATTSNEAYQLYLQGRYYWSKNTQESNRKSGEYFQKAIAIDPKYALAWAGLSDYYAALTATGFLPGREGWPKAEEAAVKAIVLDESVGEAHHSLAAVHMWYDHRWREAEKELKRAIELKPDFAEAYTLYARLLDVTGRSDEAIEVAKKSTEVDPNGPHRRALVLGGYYTHAGQYDLALESYQKTIQEDPGAVEAYIGLGVFYVHRKMFPEALSAARKAKSAAGNPRQLARVGCVLAAAGDTDEARKILDAALASKRLNLTHSIACIHAALGNNDEAISWLTKSIDDFNTSVIELNVDTRFESLRGDLRFTALLGRLKLLQ